jgi:hypothetical protein
MTNKHRFLISLHNAKAREAANEARDLPSNPRIVTTLHDGSTGAAVNYTTRAQDHPCIQLVRQ